MGWVRALDPRRSGTYPSRVSAAAAVREHLRGVGEGTGAFVLVTGPRGSGRSQLLRAVAADILRDRPRTGILVYERRDELGRLEGWPTKVAGFARQGARALSVSGTVAGATGLAAVPPATRAASAALTNTARGIDYVMARALPDVHDVAELFRQARSRARAKPPGALIVDDLDAADVELWSAQLRSLVQERLRGLDLAVVVSVRAEDGDEMATPDLVGWVDARARTDRRTARVHLPDIDRDDVRALVGRADEDVVDLLAALGGGSARVTARCWADLTRSRQVRRSLSGRWQLAASGGSARPAEAPERIWEQLVGTLPERERQRARDLLAAGALQGDVFVVEVAAHAVDLETAQALRVLAGLAAAPDPMIATPLPSPVPGLREPLHTVAFADLDIWQHLNRHTAATAAGRRSARRQLAFVTDQVGPAAAQLAPALTALARAAGDHAAVTRWQQVADRHVGAAAIGRYLAVAQALLRSNVAAERECARLAERLRDLYFDNLHVLRRPDSPVDPVQLLETAEELAHRGHELGLYVNLARERIAQIRNLNRWGSRADAGLESMARHLVHRTARYPGSEAHVLALLVLMDAVADSDRDAAAAMGPDIVTAARASGSAVALAEALDQCAYYQEDNDAALALHREALEVALAGELDGITASIANGLISHVRLHTDRRSDEVREVAERAIALPPSIMGAELVYAEAHLLLALHRKAIGDLPAAVDALLASIRAAFGIPDEVFACYRIGNLGDWATQVAAAAADSAGAHALAALGAACGYAKFVIYRRFAERGDDVLVELTAGDLADPPGPERDRAVERAEQEWQRDRFAGLIARTADAITQAAGTRPS